MFFYRKATFLVAICLLSEVASFPKPKTKNANEIIDKLKLNGDKTKNLFRLKRNFKYVYNNEFFSGSDVGKKMTVLPTNEPQQVNSPVVNDLFSQSTSKSLQIKLHRGNGEHVSGKQPDDSAAMFKASLLERATVIAKGGSLRICIHTYNSVAHSARVLTDGPVVGSSYDDDGIEYGDYGKINLFFLNITFLVFSALKLK